MHAGLFRANYPVINLLHAARSRSPHVKIIAVTNTDEVRLERMLLLIGIRFDSVVASFRVKSRKPNPAMYQAAMACAGASEKECLFIDDILENCAAAEKMGIPSYAYWTSVDLERKLNELGLITKEEKPK